MATEPAVLSGEEGDSTCLTAEGLSEKVGELEERARRLAAEELEELMRGRALNIMTGSATPMKPTGVVATAATAAAAPPIARGFEEKQA